MAVNEAEYRGIPDSLKVSDPCLPLTPHGRDDGGRDAADGVV